MLHPLLIHFAGGLLINPFCHPEGRPTDCSPGGPFGRAPPIGPKSSARSAYFSSLRPIGAAQVQVSAAEQDCLNYSRIKFHNLPPERAEVWARCKDWNAKLTMWLEEPSEGANSTKGKFSQLCFQFLTRYQSGDVSSGMGKIRA